MTLAIIGLVMSLASLVGIWVGHRSVRSDVASIGARIDGRLERVDAALDELASRLQTAQGRVEQASTSATQLGQGSADGPVADALRETTDQLSDDYANMLASFAIANEGISDARELL